MEILELLALADCVHAAHWNTTSYAEHKALGKLYEGLRDGLDTFVETYQGLFGRVKIQGIAKIEVMPSLDLCDAIQSKITDLYKETKGHKDLENILADIEGLVNHTKYLLTLK